MFMYLQIMWFSSGGTKSVVHTDSVDNINCVFSGNKSFVLVDPSKYWEEMRQFYSCVIQNEH